MSKKTDQNRIGFQRVSAPGLPPLPKLWLDAKNTRAYVCVKLATWRSHERSRITVTLLRFCLNIGVGVYIWGRLSVLQNIVGQVLITLFLVSIFAGLTRKILHDGLEGFFARQLLAVRTKFWFTSEIIAFKSRLYENGVIVRRSWNGQPVQGRFDLSNDDGITEARSQHSQQQQVRDNSHLRNASILRLVISAFNPNQTMAQGQQPSFLRAIPVLEIDSRDAQKLTVVLTAASTLTSRNENETTSQSGQGVDIDTIPSS